MSDWKARLEALEAERGTTEERDPEPAPLPCIDCGAPSAKSPCPRCGRFKW